MASNVYKTTSLDLFEDLKHTNIKNEEFKEILSSYQKLATSYINDNQTDLFKDLNKQKDVIFSYFPSLRTESIKRVAHLQKQLEAEIGNIDEIDTFSTPEKQVQFVKVAYNNGKWTIYAHNLDGVEFGKKETPQAINCLVNLVNRLDEQEAAYALCHAKKAGLFTMAALPYVRTQEFTNTALEPRYMKDPGTVLGPVDHSWESSVDNTNMPVSRQIASEESDFKEFDTFENKNGDRITISSISGDGVITLDNDILSKEEVEENIKSGYWTKVESASKDVKIKQLDKKIDLLSEANKEKGILLEANQRLVNELQNKLEDLQKQRIEQLDEIIAINEPKLKKMAAKLDSLTFENKKTGKSLQRMKYITEGGMEVRHSMPSKDYQTRMVSTEKAEAVLDKISKLVSPRNIKEYEKLANELFQKVEATEKFSINIAKTQENEDLIREKAEEFKKKLNMSQNDSFSRNAAYDELDNMLINSDITFNNYSLLSDLIEVDSKSTLDFIKKIKSAFNKNITSNVFKDAINNLISTFNSIKNWINDKLSFLSIQEKENKDINEELDQIIQEGE